MKAGLRFGIAAFAAGLALGPGPALAQAVPPDTATNTPAPETIGPRDLQDFTLNGTVTRRPDAPATEPAAPATTAPPAATRAQRNTSPAASQDNSPATARAQAPRLPAPGVIAAPRADEAQPGASLTLDLPPARPAQAALPTVPPEYGSQGGAIAANASSGTGLGMLPWLLLALLLGGGTAYLLWKRRPREALAAGPDVDFYAAPEPVPVPAPKPAPTAPRATSPSAAPTSSEPMPAIPKPAGIVSTRLRPWLEIEFVPLGCVLNDELLTVDFEIHLFNSGSGPARDVLVEASMFNAGPAQDQEIAGFFAKPPAVGETTPLVPPLKRMTIRTSLVAKRSDMRIYELGGRRTFVPLVAFNASYRWGAGSTGQTSAAYLLGRDGKGEKLGPFSAEAGPRAIRNVGARALPDAIRR